MYFIKAIDMKNSSTGTISKTKLTKWIFELNEVKYEISVKHYTLSYMKKIYINEEL